MSSREKIIATNCISWYGDARMGFTFRPVKRNGINTAAAEVACEVLTRLNTQWPLSKCFDIRVDIVVDIEPYKKKAGLERTHLCAVLRKVPGTSNLSGKFDYIIYIQMGSHVSNYFESSINSLFAMLLIESWSCKQTIVDSGLKPEQFVVSFHRFCIGQVTGDAERAFQLVRDTLQTRAGKLPARVEERMYT